MCKFHYFLLLCLFIIYSTDVLMLYVYVAKLPAFFGSGRGVTVLEELGGDAMDEGALSTVFISSHSPFLPHVCCIRHCVIMSAIL